jgi:histidine triad (HIT) family protein
MTLACDFCEIASGRDPSAEVVGAGEQWVAFFPKAPATPGHTMVIPRNHVSDVWELEYGLGSDLMRAVIDVGRAIRRALDPEGMNLISSAGIAAEQSVFHLHLHVVPRWPDDGIDQIWPPKAPMNVTLRNDLADRIREELGI